MRRKKPRGKIEWIKAEDIKDRLDYLIDTLNIDWVDKDMLKALRSTNANTRAYARIWGFSKVWQIALGIEPAYIIEVISEKFDNLPTKEKDKILLHEIAHIPKNFSGSLMPHRHGKGNFHDKLKQMIKLYNNL